MTKNHFIRNIDYHPFLLPINLESSVAFSTNLNDIIFPNSHTRIISPCIPICRASKQWAEQIIIKYISSSSVTIYPKIMAWLYPITGKIQNPMDFRQSGCFCIRLSNWISCQLLPISWYFLSNNRDDHDVITIRVVGRALSSYNEGDNIIIIKIIAIKNTK